MRSLVRVLGLVIAIPGVMMGLLSLYMMFGEDSGVFVGIVSFLLFSAPLLLLGGYLVYRSSNKREPSSSEAKPIVDQIDNAADQRKELNHPEAKSINNPAVSPTDDRKPTEAKEPDDHNSLNASSIAIMGLFAIGVLYVCGWEIIWGAEGNLLTYGKNFVLDGDGFAIRFDDLWYGGLITDRFFDSPVVSWLGLIGIIFSFTGGGFVFFHGSD